MWMNDSLKKEWTEVEDVPNEAVVECIGIAKAITVKTTINSKAYITIAIRLRYDYDEKLTCSFFARVESRRMEAGARDTS